MKKFFALVLVVLSAISLMAFPSLAEEAVPEETPAALVDTLTGSTDGTELANPWVESTEQDAYAKLGTSFAFVAPEGFTLDNAAYLGTMDATETSSVRLVYMSGEQMLRIHITNTALVIDESADDAAITETIPVEANGIQGEYDANANSITYQVGSFEISIDAPDYTQDQLTALIGSVSLADATDIEAPADAEVVE